MASVDTSQTYTLRQTGQVVTTRESLPTESGLNLSFTSPTTTSPYSFNVGFRAEGYLYEYSYYLQFQCDGSVGVFLWSLFQPQSNPAITGQASGQTQYTVSTEIVDGNTQGTSAPLQYSFSPGDKFLMYFDEDRIIVSVNGVPIMSQYIAYVSNNYRFFTELVSGSEITVRDVFYYITGHPGVDAPAPTTLVNASGTNTGIINPFVFRTYNTEATATFAKTLETLSLIHISEPTRQVR
jgi:hypothetical protein